MAKLYAKQQVGVADGTQVPPRKVDGREVNANKRSTLATKVTGTIWAVGDQVFLGKVPSGRKVVGVRGNAGTSLGTSTLSIGTLASPAKYVSAEPLTTINRPVLIGPSAAAMAIDPLATEEALWATIGGADIPGAVVLVIEIETDGI